MLSAEGILVVELPLIDNLSWRLLGKDYFAYLDKTHLQFFSYSQIVQLLTHNSFKIIKVGNTFWEYPIFILSSSLRSSNLGQFFVRLLAFLPLKIAQLIGFNREIVRLYCKKI